VGVKDLASDVEVTEILADRLVEWVDEILEEKRHLG
jgi:hypothetical protein